MTFPKDFQWGACSGSYQIEGAAFQEGKGLSVWDMMCRQPGRIWDGQNGSIACDHYHRYKEDVRLMGEIGLKAYRFSVSWPRVIPAGVGPVNGKGLDFYDKLVDALLAENIEPWVTLFHWDFPYELYCCGGWLNPASPDWFSDYVRVVVEKLSDRVSNWVTLNEPQCFLGIGHERGSHAPGDRLGRHEVLRAAHHVLLAHGKAVQTIRACAKTAPRIGWSPVGITSIPETAAVEDIAAARRAMFEIPEQRNVANPWERRDLWNNTWFGDPVIFGKYPEDGLRLFGAAVPKFTDGEMKTISEPIDFYGANIYTGTMVRATASGEPEKCGRHDVFPLTAFNWAVIPECLYWGPKYLHERYQLPVVIAENGMSSSDWISEDGRCHDPQRIDFMSRHLKECARAIADGVDVRAYFHWTIMDNFEWAEGYKERFGLIHIDYETQTRTLKDSAYWYRDLIRSNRI